MNEGKAQDLVNGAALVVASIYFYRKLIEPAAAGSLGTSAGTDAEDGPAGFISYFKGPGRNRPSQPATLGGAAAQLMGAGPVASTERFVVGWGFVFLTLSLAIPIAPELAGSFAALIALGSILGNGVQVSEDLKTQLHHEADPKAQAAAPTTGSPTTLISFAGQSFASAAPVSPTPTRRQKKPGKRAAPRVQSA